MSATQPIKSLEELERLKNYYLFVQPNYRNYALISTGINTALRISDILNLKWRDVYDFQTQGFRKHVHLTEQKTGKTTVIAINQNLHQALAQYKEILGALQPDAYIFPGKIPDAHLSRSQAFRIIKEACRKLELSEHISCHSLRKTFGYHAWASGVDPAVLMIIFNHSSFSVTKRYLGIEQDDKDRIFLTINL